MVGAVGPEEVQEVGQQQGGAGEVGCAYHQQLPASKTTIPGQSDTTDTHVHEVKRNKTCRAAIGEF